MLVGVFLSSLLASVVLAASGDPELGLGGKAVSALGLWVGLVGAAVVASRRKGSGRPAADFGLRFRPVDLPLGVAAALTAQLVVLPLVALGLSPLLGRPEVEGPARDLVGSATGPALPVLVLMVVIGAPLVEELFYRGLLVGALRVRFGGVVAVVGSAVVFGLSHQSQLPAAAVVLMMVSLGALGAVLSVLAVRTGRLGSAIVAHATFNAVTVAVVLSK
ncbi:MAG: lysostaphin resistance A-like protein [Acidimicrobiales bacterium]